MGQESSSGYERNTAGNEEVGAPTRGRYGGRRNGRDERGVRRRMTRYRVLLVAALLVLAGCSGGLSGSDDDVPDREPYSVDETVDPAANEAETDGEADVDYLAPGLTADGVENVRMLVDHHFDALERESANGTYVAVIRVTQTLNGTVVRDSRDEYVVRYPGRWHQSTVLNASEDGSDVDVREAWVTRSEVLFRVNRTDDPTRYVELDPPDRVGHPEAVEDRVVETLSRVTAANGNVTVAEERRHGTSWYVVTGDTEGERGGEQHTVVRIREDGFVERASSNATAGRGIEGQVVSRFEFRPAPNATLERPDWYEAAVEATSEDD